MGAVDIQTKKTDKLKCPFCQGQEINIIEEIDTSTIVSLYKQKYSYDVYPLIKKEKIILAHCSNCYLKYFLPDSPGNESFYMMLQKTPEYYQSDKSEYQDVKNFFTKDSNVLEVGAGKGAFSKIIDYKNYLGLELSENAVKIATKENVKLINQTIQTFSKTHSENYDVVCFFQVLEHVSLIELKTFLESSVKVLKKGGYLIISVPSDNSFVGSTPNMVLNLPPHHITRWTDTFFEKLENWLPVKLEHVYFEKLKTVNYNPYLVWRILKIFNISRPIVRKNTPIYEKMLSKFIKYIPFYFKEKIIKKSNARGHSITTVFRKV